jgi:hypothetical protein
MKMNAPERVSLLPDIQSQPDSRDLPVHAVHGVSVAEAENFESIHNRSAFARIEKRRTS